MPQLRQSLYCPRQNVEFVGEILYRRQGQTETDYDLYLNLDTRSYFVVCSESIRCGQVLSNSHTRHTVDEFLAAHPGHRRRTADMPRARAERE